METELKPQEQMRLALGKIFWEKFGLDPFSVREAQQHLSKIYTNELNELYTNAARGGKKLFGDRYLRPLPEDRQKIVRWLNQLVRYGLLSKSNLTGYFLTYTFKEEPTHAGKRPEGRTKREIIADLEYRIQQAEQSTTT